MEIIIYLKIIRINNKILSNNRSNLFLSKIIPINNICKINNNNLINMDKFNNKILDNNSKDFLHNKEIQCKINKRIIIISSNNNNKMNNKFIKIIFNL